MVARVDVNKPALKAWAFLIGAWITLGLAIVANCRRDNDQSLDRYDGKTERFKPFIYCSPRDIEWCCHPPKEGWQGDSDLGKSIEIAECLIKYVKNSYIGYNQMPEECCEIDELKGICGNRDSMRNTLSAIKKNTSARGLLFGPSFAPRHGCPIFKRRECCGFRRNSGSTGLATRGENLFRPIIQCISEIIQQFATVTSSEGNIPKVCCKIPFLAAFCKK